MRGKERARFVPARLPALLSLALLGLLLLCALPSAHAQAAPGLVPDGLALAGDLFLAGFSQTLPMGVHDGAVDPSDVNAFDRLLFFPYSRGFDVASDVTEYSTLAIPVVFAFLLSLDQASTVGFVYVEALSLALFAKNAGKYLVPRVRPWVYLAPGTGKVPRELGGDDSFPSGHASMSFAAAAFSVSVFSLYFSSAPWYPQWSGAFAALNYGLAAATAAFRVFAGMHFMTDIIAGAILGTVIGNAIVLTHTAGSGGTGKSTQALRLEVPILSLSF
jgi:membrane-associated phospholipid phosphatase